MLPRKFTLLISSALLLFPQATVLSAVTLSVTSLADTVLDDGVCTLREAVIAANEDFPSGANTGECPAGFGADRIVLTLPGTYKFTLAGTGEGLAQTGDLDVTEDLEIEGNDPATYIIDAASLDRVFHVIGSTVSLAIKKVTVTGGNEPTGKGGGIFNSGHLTITDSVITGNRADFDGGGIFNKGDTLTLIRTTISLNSNGLHGGGVYNRNGTLSVTECVFQGNIADSDGGGIYNGVLANLVVTDSIFHSNFADSLGGAINNRNQATVTGSTFTDNSAELGGAIRSSVVSLVVRNSTFHRNRATAGGAIYASFADVVLQGVTFDEGAAFTSSAIFNASSTVKLSNTIIAGRCDGDPLTSDGGNIESPGNTCGLMAMGDQSAVTAAALNLLPLQDNGGATPTQLPGNGSGAVEGGIAALCLITDQRGVSRAQDFDGIGGAECDVGATELKPCSHAEVVSLESSSVTTDTTYFACLRIEGGPDFDVAFPGKATMIAGDVVVLKNGFSVGDGATLTIQTKWGFWETIP